MSARKPPNLSDKCAAALLAITDEHGKPLIPWEEAKQMTSAQIIGLFDFDHYPFRVEAGGPTEPWNLVPRFKPAHRIKTAKIDIPEIAKIKRVSAEHDEFRRRVLTPRNQREPRRSRWPKRSIQNRRETRDE